MPSFDVVIEADLQEVDNALNQARKEIGQRYDFRGTKSTIDWDRTSEITLSSDDESKLAALLDVVKGRLHRRGVSIKNLRTDDPVPAGGNTMTQKVSLQIGVPTDTAKEIVKRIKQAKIKVQGQIQQDQVRVSGKKRDALQEAIAIVKDAELGYDFKFTNYRD